LIVLAAALVTCGFSAASIAGGSEPVAPSPITHAPIPSVPVAPAPAPTPLPVCLNVPLAGWVCL
jgi:hypothetical protein